MSTTLKKKKQYSDLSNDDIVTAKILAKDLHADDLTIYKWVRERKIPFYRLNSRCLRFSRREVREALARYRVQEQEAAS
jgi:excisionase family DNA binding protein